jgi:Transcriptional regulator, AbiEi antitoxin
MVNLRTVRRVAHAQHGLITACQLGSAGLSPDAIYRLVQRGILDNVGFGVFAVMGSPPTPERAIMAAVLGADEGAYASHRSAAWLWGYGDPPDLIDLQSAEAAAQSPCAAASFPGD